MTGRNHHSVGMGGITEIATSAPGYSSMRPNTKAPLAETLKLNGYSHRAVRQVPRGARSGRRARWARSIAGRRVAAGSSTSTASSAARTTSGTRPLYEGLTPVEPPKTPEEGYHLTEDLADNAIGWVRQQKALMPDKPFFMYFAPGATHAPHHVPKEWIEKYQGQFTHGWDKQREITFAEQKALGVIGAGCRVDAASCRDPWRGTTWIRPSSRSSSARWRSTPPSCRTPTTTSAG